MREPGIWGKRAGLVLHVLIGGLLLVGGAAKVLGLIPLDEVAKHGLAESIRLIGVGEMVTAALLLIPRTSSLGVLLTSSYWGGAICIHMAHAEPYVIPSVLLVLTWVGAYLRIPATFSSFGEARTGARQVADKAEPATV
jgi:hypothetical protein